MGSDLGILGKRKCVMKVDPKIRDHILDLALADEDLNGAKVPVSPVDDRRSSAPK